MVKKTNTNQSAYKQSDLATIKNVSQMVDAYDLSVKEMEEGYRLLESSHKRLVEFFGEQYSDFNTINTEFRGSVDETIEFVKLKLKTSAWKQIINRLGLRKLLSVKRAEELDESLRFDANTYWNIKHPSYSRETSKKLPVPELTHQEVLNFITDVTNNSDEMAKEAIKEVYEGLKSHAHGWGSKQLKTNQKNAKFDIGKKIILGYIVDHTWGGGKPHIRYENQSFFIALERVFRMLDGKPIPDGYVCELVDAIQQNSEGETEYFKYRACLNQNLHLEFKRLDLVQKLNYLAGNSVELKG